MHSKLHPIFCLSIWFYSSCAVFIVETIQLCLPFIYSVTKSSVYLKSKQYNSTVRKPSPHSFRRQGFAILNDSTVSIENFIRGLLRCINVISFAVTRLGPSFTQALMTFSVAWGSGRSLFIWRQWFWKSLCFMLCWGKDTMLVIHWIFIGNRVYLLICYKIFILDESCTGK